MKATGIVRRIDDLGRVVIPKEICSLTMPVKYDTMMTVNRSNSKRSIKAKRGA